MRLFFLHDIIKSKVFQGMWVGVGDVDSIMGLSWHGWQSLCSSIWGGRCFENWIIIIALIN